jgi:membrane protein involved in colicin uptake
VLSEVIDASVINPEAAGQQHCRLAASCHCKQEQEQQEKQLQQQQMQQQPPPQQPPQQQQQPPLQKLCELGLSQRSDNVDVLLPRCGERVSLTIRRVLKEHRALSLLRR